MNPQKKALANLISLFALTMMLIVQVLPASGFGPTPAQAAAPVVSDGKTVRVANAPLDNFSTACSTPAADNPITICIPDGDGTDFPSALRLQVQPGGTGAFIQETIGTPLTVSPGDVLRIPVAIFYKQVDTCEATKTINLFTATFGGSYNTSNFIALSTYFTGVGGGRSPDLTAEADAAIGPFTSGTTDTGWGYFEYPVTGNESVSQGGVKYIPVTIQTKINRANCTSAPTDTFYTLPDARRPKLVGFGINFGSPTASVAEQNNSPAFPVSISGGTGYDSFTYNASFSPAVTGINVTFNNCLTTPDGAGNISGCTLTVGPMPQQLDTLTLFLNVTATPSGGGAPLTLSRSKVITILHPSIIVTKLIVNPKPSYAVGDEITYSVTIANGPVKVKITSIVDSLVAVDSNTMFATCAASNFDLGVGQSCSGTYTYTVTDRNTNPLQNTVTVTAVYDPLVAGGTLVNVTQVAIASATIQASDLDVQKVGAPNPNYARPGSTFSGNLKLTNTGNQPLTNLSGNYQLVNSFVPSAVLGGGVLGGLPDPLAVAGNATVGYTVSIPVTLDPAVFSVDAIFSITATTGSGAVITRTVIQRVDVVREDLRIIVTADDAPTGVVTRGQTVTYSVRLQNVSTSPSAPISNIKITSVRAGSTTIPGVAGTLDALVAAFNPTRQIAAGANVLLGTFTYTVQTSDNSPLQVSVDATFGAANKPTTGTLGLFISDVALSVGVFPLCQFPNGTDLTLLCDNAAAAPIIDNAITVPTTVRYAISVTNVAQTKVTNVLVCLGNLLQRCTTPAEIVPTQISTLTIGGQSARGQKSATYSIAITAPFYTQVVTVFATDPDGKEVTFRQTVTLAIVNPDAYFKTASKTTTTGRTSVYVGETITYQVKACLDGSGTTAKPLNPGDNVVLMNFTASDPLAPGGITLTETDINGVAVIPANTGTTLTGLKQGNCAVGSYTYIPTNAQLNNAQQADLTNTVRFTWQPNSKVEITELRKSLVLKLNNPLKLTKIAAATGTNNALSTPLYTGEPFDYLYTIQNLGPADIIALDFTDKVGTVAYPTGCTSANFPKSIVKANQTTGDPTTLTVRCAAYAYGASGESGKATAAITNTFTGAGTIGGVVVGATTSATLNVIAPITVTKIANPRDPYYYDPAITYTVRVKNVVTPTSRQVEVKLTDATDSLNNVVTPAVGPTTSVSVNGGTPRALNGTTLLPGDEAVFTYQLLPAKAPKDADLSTSNTVTVSAQVTKQAATTLPDTPEYKFTVFATEKIIVYVPIAVSVCPVPSPAYVGWSEPITFPIKLQNTTLNTDARPADITLTKIQTTLSGTLTDLNITGKTDLPRGTAPSNYTTLIFSVPTVLPWNETRKSFDNDQVIIFFTISGVSGKEFFVTESLKECNIKIGPPLVVEKKADPSTVDALPTNISYTVTVTNKTSTLTASNLVLTDKTFGNTPLALLVPSLAPGASTTLVTPFIRPYTSSDPSPLVNTVELTGKLNNQGPAFNETLDFPTLTATASVSRPSPILQVDLLTFGSNGADKTAFNPVFDEVRFTARVKNNSREPISVESLDANFNATGVTFDNLKAPSDGYNAWKTARGNSLLEPGETVFIEQASSPQHTGTFSARIPADAFTRVPPVAQIVTTLTVRWKKLSNELGSSIGTGTIDVLNPNLQVSIRNQTKGVVPYGQAVVYRIQVTVPSDAPADATELVIADAPPSASDIVGDWYFDNGTLIGRTPPTTLAKGRYIYKDVRHVVTRNDFSPLTYTISATAKFTQGATTFVVTDTRSSTIIISASILNVIATPQKTSMLAGDSNVIEVEYQNIGDQIISTLTVNVTAEKSDGTPVVVGTLNFSATCVLNPIPNADTAAKCQQLPPISAPNNVLDPLGSSTLSTYSFKVPSDLTLFNQLPNPLILRFDASGTFSNGVAFDTVTTKVPIKIQRADFIVTETPSVSAVPVNSSLTYSVTIANLTSNELTITSVVDVAGKPIVLKLTGTVVTLPIKIPGSGSVTYTTDPVPVVPGTNSPYLHTTTATGYFVVGTNQQDTSSSTVTVLANAVDVKYTGQGTVNRGALATFNLEVTNSGSSAAILSASDVTTGATPIPLFNARSGGTLVTTAVAPGTTLYGTRSITAPMTTGTITSNIEVTARAGATTFTANASAQVEVVGTGLIFTAPPVALPVYGKVNDPINVSFTVKNTGADALGNLTNLTVECVNIPTCVDVTPNFNGSPLAFGQTKSGTIKYLVAADDYGTVTLPIRVTGDNTVSGVTTKIKVEGSVTFTVTVGNLVITKMANKTSAQPGDTITYTVTLKNTGATDILFPASGAASDTLKGDVTSLLIAQVSATANKLLAGGTVSFQYTYTVPAASLPQTLTNTVTAAFSVAAVPFTASASSVVSIVPAGTQFIVTVTPSKPNAKAGDVIKWITRVTNISTPAGSITLSNPTTSLAPLATNITSGPVPAGEFREFISADYIIPPGASGQISNVVVVNGTISGQTYTASGTGTVNIISPNGLIVTKVADRTSAKAGDTVTYTVTVTNRNTFDVDITSITDSQKGQILPGSPTPTPVALKIGITKTFQYSRVIGASEPAGLSINTVDVTVVPLAGNSFSASATATVIITNGSAGLIIAGQTSAFSYSGGTSVNYTITVVNTGSTAITGVTASYTIVGDAKTGTISLGTSSIAAGQTIVVPLTTAPIATPDPLVLNLSISGTSGGTTISATGTTNPVPLAGAAGVPTILFYPTPTQAGAGDKITYTFTITNTNAANITLSAANFVPAGTNLDPLGLTVANPFAALNGLVLTASGGSKAIFFTYTVQQTDLSKASLTAQATVSYQVGAAAPIAIVKPAASVSLAKSLVLEQASVTCPNVLAQTTRCLVKPGDVINFKVTIRNTGTSALTGIQVSLNTTPTTTLSPTQTTLAAGASFTQTFAYTVPSGGPDTSATPIDTPKVLTLTVTATQSGPIAMGGGGSGMSASLPMIVLAQATGTTVVAVGPSITVQFVNPQLSLSNFIVTSAQPIAELTPVTLRLTVANASTTSTTLQIQRAGSGSPAVPPDSFKVMLKDASGNFQDITSKVTFAVAAVGGTPPPTASLPTSLTPTQSVDYTLTYTLQATDPNPLVFMVSVAGCVTSTGPTGSVVTGLVCNSQTSITTPVAQTSAALSAQINRAQIVVTPDASNPSSAQLGTPITLKFNLTNPGAVPLINLSLASLTVNNAALATSAVTLSATTLGANSTTGAIATLTYTPVATTPQPTTLQFILTFTGQSQNGQAGVLPTVTTVYTTGLITLGNGSVAANGLTILKVASVTGGSAAATAVTQAAPTATAGLPTTTPIPGQATAATVPAPSANVRNGSQVTFTITVTNSSATPITSIVVNDQLPPTLAYVSSTQDTGTSVAGSNAVTLNVGTLQPGGKATLTIVAKVQNATPPATIANSACATSTTNTTPICSTVSLAVVTSAGLLPTTGLGGGADGASLYVMLMLGMAAFIAMAATRGRGNRTLLIVGGVVALVIATALILSIIQGTTTRVTTVANATGTAAQTQVVQLMTNAAPIFPTATPIVSATPAPTLPPEPTSTVGPTFAPIIVPTQGKMFTPNGDPSMFVPRLGLPGAVPIINLPVTNNTWDVSTLGHSVGHLDQTSWLGRDGNTVLVAHIQLSYKDFGPFLNLKALQVGDPVMVYDKGGYYMYEVTGAKVVDPTAIDVTYPTGQAQLTLITCTVWDAHRGAFAKRLVVTAKLVSAPPNV